MRETTVALLMGNPRDGSSLSIFLGAIHKTAGRLIVFVSNDIFEKINPLSGSITFHKLGCEALSQDSGDITTALSEALNAVPEAIHFMAIDCSGKLPPQSRIIKALKAGFDYMRVSNCMLISRKYAEQIVRTRAEPSHEDARTHSFRVPSLVSEFIHSPRQTIRENTIIKFAIVGASGTIINYVVVGLFKIWLPWLSLVIADAIGIELSIINNFIWNDRYTFKNTQVQGQPHLFQAAGVRFAKYNSVSLISTFVNLAVFYSLASTFGIYWVWSLSAAIASAFLINYVGSSRWAWKPSKDKPPALSVLKN